MIDFVIALTVVINSPQIPVIEYIPECNLMNRLQQNCAASLPKKEEPSCKDQEVLIREMKVQGVLCNPTVIDLPVESQSSQTRILNKFYNRSNK